MEKIAIGTSMSVFNQMRVLSGKSEFNANDVQEVLLQCLERRDHELLEFEQEMWNQNQPLVGGQYSLRLENTHYIVSKLCLLLSVMRKSEFERIKYFEANGNCAALLTDQKIWNNIDTKVNQNLACSDQFKNKEQLLTVNFHLEKTCNYKCKFCYVMPGFERKEEQLNKEKGLELIEQLHEFGIYKINFAGGEPLLNKHLSEYIQYSKSLGLKVSIISNASRMTNSWINLNCPFIDQVGISCDSLDDRVQVEIGRGFGNHVDITRRALNRINKFNETSP